MLKRNLFFILIIAAAFVFTINAFGQNSKRKQTKPKASQIVEFQDGDDLVLRRKNKNKRTTSKRSKPKSKASDTQQNAQLDYYLAIHIPDTTRRKPKSKQRTTNASGNVNKPLKNNIPRQGGGTRGKSRN